MRLVRLGLVAFGRFVGQSVDLEPGLNVVYGPNEAGKSTIQKFILAMLYGLKKQGTRREYTADHARYQPWGSEEYRGVLTYALSDNRTYRVERDFSIRRERVSVYDDLTGQDLTASFTQDRRKELLFAERHLRVTEGVFVSTAWVGQMETAKLAMAKELSARIANLQESGREDMSVREALRVLDDQIKEIGSERAPTRPYARTLQLIGEKEAELLRAQRAREETLVWEESRGVVQAQLEQVEAELQQAATRYELARLREAERHLGRATELNARVQELAPRLEELQRFAAFPREQREDVHRLGAEIGALAEQEQAAAAQAEALAAEKAALAAEVARYSNLQNLGPSAVSDLTMATALLRASERQADLLAQELKRARDAIAHLDEALAPLQEIGEKGAGVVARVDAIEEEIAGLHMHGVAAREPAAVQAADEAAAGAGAGADAAAAGGAPAETGRTLQAAAAQRQARRPLLAIGSGALLVLIGILSEVAALSGLLPELHFAIPLALAAAGILVFAGGRRLRRRQRAAEAEQPAVAVPAPVRGAARAAPEVLAMAERLRQLEAERQSLLASVHASSVTDLKSRLLRWEQFSARHDSYQTRLQTLQTELEQRRTDTQSHRQLAVMLLSGWQGVSPEDVRVDDAAVEEFRHAWERWADVRQRHTAVSRSHEEAAERHRVLGQRLAQARVALAKILDAAGVSDAEEFLEGCRRREEYQGLKAEHDAAERALARILQGDSLETLQARAEELRRHRAETATAAPPELDPETAREAVEVLREDVRLLERRQAELQNQVSDLSARLETALRDVADIAGLEGELGSLREELALMDRELQALEMARDHIEMVSADIHREFAPLLNKTMGDILAGVTGGRYTEVKVDESLGLRALAPGNRLVEVADLSSGTVDQFYLALRLALVRLITAGGEPLPLLLDDPFVQYDDERVRGAIACLKELATGDNQIVLFTCHQRDAEIARNLDARIVDLSGMQGG